jgi:hypothetical protein
MGPIRDCGVQRAARKMLIRESQPPDRRLSTHRFGVVFNCDLSATMHFALCSSYRTFQRRRKRKPSAPAKRSVLARATIEETTYRAFAVGTMGSKEMGRSSTFLSHPVAKKK